MIFFKILFFVFCFIGFSFFWMLFGFVFVALNQEKFNSKYSCINHIKKLVCIGPIYLSYLYIVRKNKKEHYGF